MSGLLSIYRIRRMSIGRSCKQDPRHFTLLSAKTRTRPGSRCWKRHMPKLMVIMVLSQVAGSGKTILSNIFSTKSHAGRD